MNQKELTETFMMISNWKNLDLYSLYNSISALEGLIMLDTMGVESERGIKEREW